MISTELDKRSDNRTQAVHSAVSVPDTRSPSVSEGVSMESTTQSTFETNLAVLIIKIMIHSVTAVFVVTFWRGFWVAMDHFSSMDTPSGKLEAALVSIAISAVAPLVFGVMAFCVPKRWLNIMKESLSCTVPDVMSKVMHYLIIYVFGCSNIAFWRGFWYLLDVMDVMLFPDYLFLSHISTLLLSGLVLMLMNRLTAFSSVPMMTPITDSDHAVYTKEMQSPVLAFWNLFHRDDEVI